jgi:hypothetical protein
VSLKKYRLIVGRLSALIEKQYDPEEVKRRIEAPA